MGSFEVEIASLDKVLTRLALTEEAQLEKVAPCPLLLLKQIIFVRRDVKVDISVSHFSRLPAPWLAPLSLC